LGSPAEPYADSFFDELTKIAEDREEKGSQVFGKGSKKWWKNTLLIGAGSAGGVAAATAADLAFKKYMGRTWDAMPSGKRAAILGPIAAISALGAHAAAKRLQDMREGADRG